MNRLLFTRSAPYRTAPVAMAAGLGVLAVWLASRGAVPADATRALVWLLLSPLVEETVFRAGLHEELLRRRVEPVVANVLTAAAFGAAHVWAWQDLAGGWVAAPALAVGVLYQQLRRLWPCIALHAAMNAAALIFMAGLA